MEYPSCYGSFWKKKTTEGIFWSIYWKFKEIIIFIFASSAFLSKTKASHQQTRT